MVAQGYRSVTAADNWAHQFSPPAGWGIRLFLRNLEANRNGDCRHSFCRPIPRCRFRFALSNLGRGQCGGSLLTSTKKIDTLMPGNTTLRPTAPARNRGAHSVSLHDRDIILDRANCYHSGASFKDGAKSSSNSHNPNFGCVQSG
jgi:hypothetical protein